MIVLTFSAVLSSASSTPSSRMSSAIVSSSLSEMARGVLRNLQVDQLTRQPNYKWPLEGLSAGTWSYSSEKTTLYKDVASLKNTGKNLKYHHWLRVKFVWIVIFWSWAFLVLRTPFHFFSLLAHLDVTYVHLDWNSTLLETQITPNSILLETLMLIPFWKLKFRDLPLSAPLPTNDAQSWLVWTWLNSLGPIFKITNYLHLLGWHFCSSQFARTHEDQLCQ